MVELSIRPTFYSPGSVAKTKRSYEFDTFSCKFDLSLRNRSMTNTTHKVQKLGENQQT